MLTIQRGVRTKQKVPANSVMYLHIFDAAYCNKYRRRYGERIVGGVGNPASRNSTIKLVPR
jgi:hypothetical protein